MTPEARSDRISDFSAIAERYDQTRNIPQQCLLTAYDRLVEQGLLPAQGIVMDIGCGTGQISLPLAERGYHVRGIDVSEAMIARARSKLHPDWNAHFRVGDARHLVEDNGWADAVVSSKVLQHVENWQQVCREMIRVVRPGRCIFLIDERAAFGDAVRRQFRARASRLGFERRYLGLDPQSKSLLTEFMRGQLCESVPIDTTDIRWETQISYGEALSRIQDGLFAEFWYLPSAIRGRLIEETADWIQAQPDEAATIDHLSPHLSVRAFRKPAA